jgi:guanylate kinase
MKKGKLIVISGPSGVGKSTIRDRLLEENDNLWYSISMTTRPPRGGEEHGVHYFFVTEEEFLESISKHELIEYMEVYKGTYYGTPKKEIDKRLKKGIDVLLEIDVDGAMNIKNLYKDALMIFISPPSLEELEKRLKLRNTNSIEDIKERLIKARYEIDMSKNYDFVVTNDNLEKCVKKINDFIKEKKN